MSACNDYLVLNRLSAGSRSAEENLIRLISEENGKQLSGDAEQRERALVWSGGRQGLCRTRGPGARRERGQEGELHKRRLAKRGQAQPSSKFHGAGHGTFPLIGNSLLCR